MDTGFWHERWETQQIGFHEGQPNALLVEHADCLALGAGMRVFVPLCGKSVDLRWLRERGAAVLGCELSPVAVKAFFDEQGLAPRHTHSGAFAHWEADDIALLCGNFFDLSAAELAGCQSVYDRAALIALPADMRRQYAARLRELLTTGTRMLLITVEYPQSEMSGPPFSVSMEEVHALFAGHADIRHLASHERLENEPRFKQRGLTRLTEHAFCLVWH